MESPSVPAHRGGALPWQGLLLTVSLLSFWNPPVTAKMTVESVPRDVAEGNPVLLLVHNIPPNPIIYKWYRNEIEEDKIIIKWIVKPESTTLGPLYSNRETIYSNGSLLIQNLTMGDSGTYAVQVVTENLDTPYGTGQVRVHALLPQPSITVNNSSPVEQKDSVVLMCEPESSGTTYQWFNNTQPIQPSTRLQLSPDNRTLTVLHVTRNDRGPYECETSNLVSVHRSNPFNLTVLYGPDAPTISPSKRDYLGGEKLSLSCLTASYPPAEVSWFIGEKPLGSTQTLSIPNLSVKDSGSYSCLVSNSATHLNRTTVINITVSANPGLSAGSIAGTVIGVLAGVALIAALVYFLYVKKTRRVNDQHYLTENKLSASNHSQDYSEISSNKIEEPAYSSLDFDDQKHIEKQVAESPGPTSTEAIYSQVKKN